MSTLSDAVRRYLEAENAVHLIYPNTAACNSRPGIVAGQAMTPHCALTCRSPQNHTAELTEHSSAFRELTAMLALHDQDLEEIN